jgi:peptidoglycan/xylan/chitin deacetylase (PgdA/CDA1 family)
MTVTLMRGTPAEEARSSVPVVAKVSTNYAPSYFAAPLQSTLQSGHGWTGTNNGAGDLNYTSDKYQGTQCIKLTTTGGGGNATPTYVTSPRTTAFNMSAKMARFWLKVDGASIANLSLIRFYFGSGAAQFTNFAHAMVFRPVDAYASIVPSDEWFGITINPASLVEITGTVDWSAIQDIRVRIEDNGVGGQAATVLFGGIEFIDNDTAYGSHGVISICFDDGYASCVTQAAAVLQSYSFQATAFIIRNLIDQANYLTAAQLASLRSTYGWDVQVHADIVANHNLTNGFVGLSNAALTKEYVDEINWLNPRGYPHRYYMAYPKGMTDATVLSVTGRYFAAARTVQYRTVETLPVCSPLRLRSVTPNNTTPTTPNTTPATLEWYVDQVYNYGGWLILSFHELVSPATTGTQFLPADFSTLMGYINTKGVPVRLMKDVLGLPTLP